MIEESLSLHKNKGFKDPRTILIMETLKEMGKGGWCRLNAVCDLTKNPGAPLVPYFDDPRWVRERDDRYNGIKPGDSYLK